MEIRKTFNVLRVILVVMLLASGVLACKDDDDDDDDNDNKVEFKNISLLGANEVPAVTTTSTGTFNGTYDKNTKMLTYTVSWTLAEGETVSNMHFHGPAATTESAGVAIGITGFPTTATGSYSGTTAALTSDQEMQLLDGKWYINIHTPVNPGGEIRGNLIP
jgi:hypothetical protein